MGGVAAFRAPHPLEGDPSREMRARADEGAPRRAAGDATHEMRSAIDRRVVAHAATVQGVATTARLVGAGLTRDGIAHRVAHGWLIRRHRGVYLVGPVAGPFAEEMAAAMAIGADAGVSNGAAAAMWKIRARIDGPIDVSVGGRHARSRPGIRVHNVSVLERTVLNGVPVTTPAWTLLDLAATLAADDLARAVEEARVLRLVTPADLERLPRRPGRAALLRTLEVEPRMTRSEGERRLVAVMRRAGLPMPQTNVRVVGHEVDALWPEQRLVVEVDGIDAHGITHAQFERDRARDASLVAAGYRVIRVTWRQLRHEPELVAARIAAALAVR
jgi:very-short-patch-repair endonuclease